MDARIKFVVAIVAFFLGRLRNENFVVSARIPNAASRHVAEQFRHDLAIQCVGS
jgi:hypothetical protein